MSWEDNTDAPQRDLARFVVFLLSYYEAYLDDATKNPDRLRCPLEKDEYIHFSKFFGTSLSFGALFLLQKWHDCWHLIGMRRPAGIVVALMLVGEPAQQHPPSTRDPSTLVRAPELCSQRSSSTHRLQLRRFESTPRPRR